MRPVRGITLPCANTRTTKTARSKQQRVCDHQTSPDRRRTQMECVPQPPGKPGRKLRHPGLPTRLLLLSYPALICMLYLFVTD